LDIEEVIRAARDHNVVLEINNSSFSLSRQGSEANCVRIMELIDRLDWKVVFGSDSHIAYSVGDFEHATAHAQRIGFPEQRIVNATAPRFLRFLGEHEKPVAVELKSWASQFETAGV
jgi:putative hydrolase